MYSRNKIRAHGENACVRTQLIIYACMRARRSEIFQKFKTAKIQVIKLQPSFLTFSEDRSNVISRKFLLTGEIGDYLCRIYTFSFRIAVGILYILTYIHRTWIPY